MKAACLVVSDCLGSHGLYSSWHSPGQYTAVSTVPFSRASFQPRMEPRSPALQVGKGYICREVEVEEGLEGK